MALNPTPGVCEQVSDYMRTAADQNAATVAQVAANTAGRRACGPVRGGDRAGIVAVAGPSMSHRRSEPARRLRA
jgi:hypothetical protein